MPLNPFTNPSIFFEEFLKPETPPSFARKPHFREQKKPAGQN